MTRSKWIARFGAGMLGIGLTAAALLGSAAPADACTPSPFCIDPDIPIGPGVITVLAPDLRVQNISVLATPTTVTISYQVRNAGSAAAGGSWSRVQVDGVTVGFRFSAGLPAGSTDTFTVSFPNPAGLAIHTVTANADVTNAVSELLEGNNSLTLANQKW